MSQQARAVGGLNGSFVVMQILVFAAIIAGLYVLLPTQGFSLLPVIVGGGLYLLWSELAQRVLLRDHRAGMQFLRAGAYAQAIPSFEQSAALFERRPWLDSYRWLTLLSPSAISYREMALNNMGYAYLQLGKQTQARAVYQKLVEAYPQGAATESARTVIARIDAQNASSRSLR